MMKQKMYRIGAIFILIGVIIGFIISSNLDLTTRTEAEATTVALGETVTHNENSEAIGSSTINELSNTFANVAEKVNPSIVTIFTEKIVKQRRHPFFQFPFEEFFGEDFNRYFNSPQVPEREQKHYGLGSGVIVSTDGVIITNNHVIEGADNIKIRLLDDTEYDAEIKGTDGTRLSPIPPLRNVQSQGPVP